MVYVISAIEGNVGPPRSPLHEWSDVKRILFTSKDVSVHGWETRSHKWSSSLTEHAERRSAKLAKVMWPMLIKTNKNDVVVWHDANHDLLRHPLDIIEPSNAYLNIYQHCYGNSIEKEKKEIAKSKRENQNLLDRCENIIYKISKKEDPVYSCSCAIYDMSMFDEAALSFHLTWWEIICASSSRDQLSIHSSIKKSGVSHRIINRIPHAWPPNKEIEKEFDFIRY